MIFLSDWWLGRKNFADSQKPSSLQMTNDNDNVENVGKGQSPTLLKKQILPKVEFISSYFQKIEFLWGLIFKFD